MNPQDLGNLHITTDSRLSGFNLPWFPWLSAVRSLRSLGALRQPGVSQALLEGAAGESPGVEVSINGPPNGWFLRWINHVKALKMKDLGVPVPPFQESSMYGTCMEHVWNMYGTSMANKWCEGIFNANKCYGLRKGVSLTSWTRMTSPQNRAATVFAARNRPGLNQRGTWVQSIVIIVVIRSKSLPQKMQHSKAGLATQNLAKVRPAEISHPSWQQEINQSRIILVMFDYFFNVFLCS